MRGRYWHIKIENKEMIVKATTSSAAIRKTMMDFREGRKGRDLNHDEKINIEIVRTSWQVMIEWQKARRKVIL